MLGETHYITSDAGIDNILKNKGLQGILVENGNIQLNGFSHGFFGGTCGTFQNYFFIMGSLKYHQDGWRIRLFLDKHHYQLIELYDGNLFDGGSILFS